MHEDGRCPGLLGLGRTRRSVQPGGVAIHHPGGEREPLPVCLDPSGGRRERRRRGHKHMFSADEGELYKNARWWWLCWGEGLKKMTVALRLMDSAAASRSTSPPATPFGSVRGRDYWWWRCSCSIRIDGGSGQTSLTLPAANTASWGKPSHPASSEASAISKRRAGSRQRSQR